MATPPPPAPFSMPAYLPLPSPAVSAIQCVWSFSATFLREILTVFSHPSRKYCSLLSMPDSDACARPTTGSAPAATSRRRRSPSSPTRSARTSAACSTRRAASSREANNAGPRAAGRHRTAPPHAYAPPPSPLATGGAASKCPPPASISTRSKIYTF